ncbi:MAG: c-type cytochrome, partial [Planctomycetia bacterium]
MMLLGWLGGGAAAAPRVAGFERFGRAAAEPAATVESGLLLLGELGCVNCHATGQQAATHLLTKQGPNLDSVGGRIEPAWLAAYLRAPHAVKPGTTMPDLLAGLPAAERDRVATAIAHVLASTAAFDKEPLVEAAHANALEGGKIYERSGCAVCHGSRQGKEPLL